MKEVSDMLFKYFTELEVFKKEMRDRLYPIYVSEQKVFPLAVYNIGEVPYISKDARSFPVTLSLCYAPENYSAAMVFADEMKEAVDNFPNGEYLSTQTIFDDENEYIYININFNVIQ